MLCLLVSPTDLKGFIGFRIMVSLFTIILLVSGVYVASKKICRTIIAALLALPTIMFIWINHFVNIPYFVLVGDCFGILFMAFTAITVLSFIFREKHVSINVIYSSIVVYLLIAVMWSFVYSAMESVHPGSFKIAKEQIEVGRYLFVYYSFVTITSLGYVDMSPITAQANSFSILEAVTGQIYLVVLVARLVGMHIAQSMDKNAR